jgi:dTDP-4-amino-4,6-dideoxygalactose transaminase
VTVPFLDLSRGVAALRDELEAAVASVLDSGRFVLGPNVEAFEEGFARFCGARRCVGVASGTEAITLALGALGVGAGDEVITAANTCVPTVAGIAAARATPVLVDAEPETLTLDPAHVEDVLTERTRAIVPVHLYGQCADVEPLLALARSRGLKLLEDAAQAHGAEYRGRRAGTLGDAAAFSFYPTKNLGALGDAGAIVTDDDEVAERARMLRDYGERERYESLLPGTNSRLDELQAAVLTAKLPHLELWNARRRELADAYRHALAGTPLTLPAEREDGRHAYHLFVVRVADRDRFRAVMADGGVETLVHYPRAVHQHPAYESLARHGLEVSERAAREVVSLPLYPELTDAEAGRVVAAAQSALD